MNTQKQIQCPYCRKGKVEQGSKYWPFCSERCRMLDLGAWAKEEYRVAGETIINDEINELSGEEQED